MEDKEIFEEDWNIFNFDELRKLVKFLIRNKMKNFKDKVAAITGTASGIGKNLAIQLAAAGARVALADFNEAGMKKTYEIIKKSGGEASCHVVDVGKKTDVFRFSAEVMNTYGSVDLVFNNAGVAIAGLKFEETSQEDIEWIFNINLWGVIHGCKAFLPYLKRQPEAVIVNVSSVFGLAGFYHNSAYCMTKFAVRGLTESLREELHDTNVQVVQVHPGGIKTGIAASSRAPNMTAEKKAELAKNFQEVLAKTTAEDAAKIILKGIKKGKEKVLIGTDAKFLDFMVRLRHMGSLKMFGKRMREAEDGQPTKGLI